MADQTEIEVVDAEVVDLEPRSSAQLAQATATQAVLVAGRRHRGRGRDRRRVQASPVGPCRQALAQGAR